MNDSTVDWYSTLDGEEMMLYINRMGPLAALLVDVVVGGLDEKGSVGALQLPNGELFAGGDVEESHLNGTLRVEDGVVGHGPLLGEGQTPQLRGLLEGFLELEGHVLGAGIVS